MKHCILLSGGFDPVHPGHIDMIADASRLGPVVIALNSDAWLTRKKGKPFMNWPTRARIMRALKHVDDVVPVDDRDGTVCSAIRTVMPTMFGNGGDRTAHTTPSEETLLCARLGVQCVFGLGGGKEMSSSALIACAEEGVERKWGMYRVLYEGHGFKVKLLRVEPGKATSMQRHYKRHEVWCYHTGEVTHVMPLEWHQLKNPFASPLHLIEVQVGSVLVESDIERSAS